MMKDHMLVSYCISTHLLYKHVFVSCQSHPSCLSFPYIGILQLLWDDELYIFSVVFAALVLTLGTYFA